MRNGNLRLKRTSFSTTMLRRLFHVLLSHLTAMLAVIIIICFIIDRFNTAMEFMTSDLSRWLIFILAILALTTSVLTIVTMWVKPREDTKRSIRRR